MKKLLLALFLAVAASPSWAIFFCDCQAGAHPSCVAGSNANPGTSSSAPKQTTAGIDFETQPVGTQNLFCEGGRWTNFSIFVKNNNATTAQPIVFGAYAPPSGATGTPRLTAGAGQSTITIGQYDDGEYDGGYTIQDLEFRGDGANGSAVLMLSQVKDVIIQRNDIREFSVGINSSAFAPSSGTALTNIRLRVLNNNIQDNNDMGFLGGSADSLIQGNTFRGNNRIGDGLNHAIYFSSSPANQAPAPRTVIRNNTFIDNSVNTTGPDDGTRGFCKSGNLTARGGVDGLLVEGNVIILTQSTLNCYGISMTSGSNNVEYFRNTVVRGNTIVNTGLVGIIVQNGDGVLVEDNVVANTQATYLEGIRLENGPDPEDIPSTFYVLRNNTVYQTQAANGARGYVITAGTNNVVANNVVKFGSGANAGVRCFTHQAIGNYAQWDYNLCDDGPGQWSGTYSSLATAQAAGFDPNGLDTDPLFVAAPTAGATWNCNVQSGSPTINSSGGSTARLARGGWSAVGTRDRGACEFGSTP